MLRPDVRCPTGTTPSRQLLLPTAMTPREHPAEQTQLRLLTPAVRRAPTLHRTHALDEPADHGEQQVDADQPKQETLHPRDGTRVHPAQAGPDERPYDRGGLEADPDQGRRATARSPVEGRRRPHLAPPPVRGGHAPSAPSGVSGPRSAVSGDPSNTSRDLREARGTAGFTWVTSHVFRKTCATILDEAGLSARVIADQLGHARPSMTQDVYMGRRSRNPETAAALEGAWADA